MRFETSSGVYETKTYRMAIPNDRTAGGITECLSLGERKM